MTVSRDSLLTDRLALRWLTLDDASLMLTIWNDPDFLRHVGDRGIRTLDDAAMALAEGPMKLYSEYGYGPYRLALRDCDTPIGICGLFRRDFLDAPDIGFALLPGYRSQGLALEAARVVVDYAGNGLGLGRLTAIVSPGNAASIALIEKLGLQFEKMFTVPGDDDEVCLYGADL